MGELPIEKVTISGPTLSSLLNHFTSSPNNLTGLLFGQLSLLPSSLSDDDDYSSSSSSFSHVATITGFLTGHPSTLLSSLPNRTNLLGWFSGRRRSPSRPSLLEHTLSHSLLHSSSSSPLFLLLLTTPFHDSLIHTHDYRVYHYKPSLSAFETLRLDVVNVGPAFRGQYTAFCPNSELPYLECKVRAGSPMREEKESLGEMKKGMEEHNELDKYVQGCGIGDLRRLMGTEAVGYMSGVEELYEKMLAKLESLAREVESSSARVLEQENCNIKLRRRVAGIE